MPEKQDMPFAQDTRYLLPSLLFYHISTAGTEQCRHHFLTVTRSREAKLTLQSAVVPAPNTPITELSYKSSHQDQGEMMSRVNTYGLAGKDTLAVDDASPTFICKHCSVHLFISRSTAPSKSITGSPISSPPSGVYSYLHSPMTTPRSDMLALDYQMESSSNTHSLRSTGLPPSHETNSFASQSSSVCPLDLLCTTAVAVNSSSNPQNKTTYDPNASNNCINKSIAGSMPHSISDSTIAETALCDDLCKSPNVHLFKTVGLVQHNQSRIGFSAACQYCQLTWKINLIQSATQPNMMCNLLKNMDLSRQATVLFMLTFYMDNLLHGVPTKPINTENPRFIEFIGVTEASISFLQEIGYRLEGKYFVPANPKHIDRAKVLLIMEEISLRKFLLEAGAGSSKSQMFSFSEATESLCMLFGVDYVGSCSSSFLSEFWTQIADLHPAYETLGTMSNITDYCVQNIYIELCHLDPTSQPKYLKALIEIAKIRKSSLLNDFIDTDQSKGKVSEVQLKEAYATLGRKISQEMSAHDIIEAFKTKFVKNPHQLAVLRQALKTIQISRSCSSLKHFLHTGQEPPQFNETAPMDTDSTVFPIGLNNLWNTCYLNSLLQLYFSLPDLRKRVFAFQPRLQSELTERERHANKFIFHLQRLFATLQWSDKPSVTPEKALVETTLTSQYSSATFGIQHDLTECMDNIMDMMEIGFGKVDAKCTNGCTLLKDLFYGTTRQTLRYTDAEGDHVSTKDESFHQLIVDADEDLYTALDAYFATQHVDFEGTSAIRCLSVVNFPPILTIQINRVKFDRITNSAYKSHNYLRYAKHISLERYLNCHLETVLQLRKQHKELTNEYIRMRHLLHSKTTFNNLPVPPLELMETSRRILYAHQEHCKDPLVFQQLTIACDKIKKQISDLQPKIEELEYKRSQIYSHMNGKEYQLYAVLVHEGEATFGHYWLFLYDLQDNGKGRWLKYNDSLVSEVLEHEVFADTTGSNANAYALVYIRSSEFSTRVGPYLRDAKRKQEYSDSFPNLWPSSSGSLNMDSPAQTGSHTFFTDTNKKPMTSLSDEILNTSNDLTVKNDTSHSNNHTNHSSMDESY
ncbi:ubiquitin-specific protease ubp2 [Batrachochytrium dendrobatidis]|nr:ubiquitin-specific protease ubp2 [Batrachochytrium dendrobatidis]KAK5665753.1 ubiquitin-specific protease ubp2 [Batrachochytrium dendrobatidis]